MNSRFSHSSTPPSAEEKDTDHKQGMDRHSRFSQPEDHQGNQLLNDGTALEADHCELQKVS